MADFYFSNGNPYIGLAAGDDSRAGTTPSSPRKSLSLIPPLLDAGHRVFLQAGSVWPISSTVGLDILSNPANGALLGYYGDIESSEPPTIDALLYEPPTASGWSSIGSNRWTKTFSVGDIVRIFPSKVLGSPLLPYAFKRVANATDVTTEGTFHFDTSTSVLTLFALGTTTAPPAYYGGLAMTRTGSGGVSINVRFRSASNIAVQGLRALGGQTGVMFQVGTTDTRNIVLEDFVSLGNFLPCISVSGVSGMCRDITIVRPHLDGIAVSNENRGTSGPWGSMNGVAVLDHASNVTVIDPVIKGQRHSAIFIAQEANVSKIKVVVTSPSYGQIDCNTIDYGRAIDASCTDWHISGLRVVGQCTQTQLGGSGTLSGCVFTGHRRATTPTNEGTDNCINWYNFSNGFSVVDINITGNYIENPVNYAFDQAYSPVVNGTMASNSVKVYRNVIVDQAFYNQRVWPQATPATPGPTGSVWLRTVSGSQASPTQLWTQNTFLLPAGATTVIVAQTASGQTNYTINGAPGAVGNRQAETPEQAGIDPVAVRQPSLSAPAIYMAGRAFPNY